jgi:large subunit ribosomal protein L15
MQIHELRPKHKLEKRKRIGRGGKKGTFSGRGSKGQSARAGRRFVPAIRSLIKRYPKLRGYRFKSFSQDLALVNVEILEKKFTAGETINPKILLEKKAIRRINGRTPKVKILAKGEIKKALNVEGCLISKTAQEKIEKAGGTVK